MFGESNSYSDMSDEERNYFVEILREEMERRERSGRPEQIRDIVPMEEFLTPYYLGDDAKKIFPYWKDFLCDMFDEKREKENRRINTAVLSGCFTGDTKVSLLDGREVSFEDLEKEYGVEGYFWVYSCDKDSKDSNVVPGLAHNVHKTKVAKKLCVVTLDNGEVIKCTPDHLFLTRSGEYKRADNLQENESLMSSDNKNHKVKSIEIIDADEWVYDLEVDAYHNFALSSGVFVHNSIGTGKSCLFEGTRIPTTIGLLTLKALYKEFHENGKRFKVLSESGLKDCIGVYDNGVAKTKKITFKSGREVEGTYNHKFRVIRDGKIEWVEFADIRVGESVLLKTEEYPFGNLHMDSDEAYTLGYMVGDGWCEKVASNGKFNSFQVMFQYENTEVAIKICQAYYNWFGRKGIKKSQVKKMPNGNHMVYLRAFDTKRATKLVKSGFGSGSRNKDIPSFIYRCDKETVSNFIQGLFDSDGTAEKDGFTYIVMNSKNCIYNLGRLLSMFGINYKITVKESYFKGKYMGKVYQLALKGTDSYVKFEREIGFNIDYKLERLHNKIVRSDYGRNRNNRVIVPDCVKVLREIDNEEKLSSDSRFHNFTQFRTQDNYTLLQLRRLYELNPEWVSKSDYLKYVCENDVSFDEVESIEDGECYTYDLTIDTDHSYCFDGFISHNTIAEIILLRKLYEISCYKNINAYFGLMASATITFIYFSLNKATALATGFSSIRAWVDNSTYFTKNFPRRKRLDSLLVFPEGVTVAYGSRATASTGRNVLCSIMDEANFINSMGDNNSGNIEMAVEMFTGLVNRSNSRFILQGGDNHSLNILVSSSTHNNSATERIIRASQDDVHAIVATPAQWDVKPNNFSKEFFYVLKGTKYMEPQIIKSTDDVNSFRIAEGLPKSKFVDNLEDFDAIEKEIQKLPPYQQDNFLKVPIDLKRGFEMNIIRSLQDMGGVSTGATGKLFNSPAVFDACIDERLAHPFIQQEIVISTGDQIEIKDYMRNNFRFKNIERPRFIHIDQSYRTDSTGISCVYVSDVMTDEETGARKPIFSTDFMLRINPPKPPRKIAIYKIRNFVVYLAQVMGVKIGKVTYDIFNSEESRQILEEMGFNVGYQSVDRNDEAYLSLVEIMYEGRLKFYDYPILRHEIFNLIHNREKRKVDHPKTVNDSIYNGKGENVGSKDVSDSIAGACLSAMKESIVDEVDERRTLNDFLNANRYNNYFEADAFSAEEMINKEIDDMIEQMEMSGFTYGDLGGVRGF